MSEWTTLSKLRPGAVFEKQHGNRFGTQGVKIIDDATYVSLADGSIYRLGAGFDIVVRELDLLGRSQEPPETENGIAWDKGFKEGWKQCQDRLKVP